MMKHAEAIRRFLRDHCGQMFCNQCLARAVLAAGVINVAVMVAEGHGARRQHGPCAACGKDRLLCGLPAPDVSVARA